ncbi:MAG: hypothetical protein WAV15_00790 [Minisyncoccia bacterium]
MSLDETILQNPTSEENSTPPSPQEPTADAPVPPMDSEPTNALPEALESSPSDFLVKSNDISPSDSTPTESQKEQKTEENQASSGAGALADKENEPIPEPITEPVEAPEPETAQIPENEPFSETEKTEIESPEPAPESPKEEKTKEETKKEPEPEKEEKPKLSYLKSQKLGELLVMARTAIQFRKRKKLDRVMSLFLKQSKITNDEVEKLLHVSDATATRYLSELEKQGKIKQNGKTGKAVSYSRI